MDYNGILRMLQAGPTDDERRMASGNALARMGLGILAANMPSTTPRSTLGVLAQGALPALDTYRDTLKYHRDERRAGAAGALTALQIKKQIEQQDALRGLLSPQPPQPITGVLAERPAGISEASADAIGAPWAARPPTAAPTAPAGQGGYQPIPLDRLAAAAAAGVNVEPFLKMNDRAQPKGENVPGVGMVNPYNGQVISPLPRITDSGRAAGLVPDGRGGWRVEVPQGSVEAYGAFQSADEAARAAFDLIAVPDGRGGTQMMPRAEAVRRMGYRGQQPQGASGLSVESRIAAPSVAPGGGLGYQRPETERQGDQRFAETLSGEMGKTYADLLRADFNAPATIGKYQRLGNLLSQVNTGKWKGTTTELKAAAKSAGIDLGALGVADDVAPAQAARALSNQLALELRNPAGGAGMPGALSDKDREFLVQSIPGLENDPNAWPLMVEYRVKLAQREQQVAKMARAYKKRAGRFDDGFYDELARWSERNPLFPEAGRAPAPGAGSGFRVLGIEGQ